VRDRRDPRDPRDRLDRVARDREPLRDDLRLRTPPRLQDAPLFGAVPAEVAMKSKGGYTAVLWLSVVAPTIFSAT
jgi:hypothetical protein